MVNLLYLCYLYQVINKCIYYICVYIVIMYSYVRVINSGGLYVFIVIFCLSKYEMIGLVFLGNEK